MINADFDVYVIKNEKGAIYIGQTRDFEKRIKRHNGALRSRKKSYTRKQGGKWVLVYQEKYQTRSEAMKREKYLKSHQGRDWLKSFLSI